MSLSEKTALVTGGSRGIGLAISRALYRSGASVMVCARDTVEVEEAVRVIAQEPGGKVAGLACDVRDDLAVGEAISRVAATFGGLDILVNNAGIALLANIDQMSPQDWRATIDTNLTGVFNCCHFAIPQMRKRGKGDIINIASRSSVNAYASGGAYCASKFGVLGLSESLNLELRRDNIRVSCVMPGRVSTDFAGEAPQDWHLSVDDVAEAVIDILSFDRRALVSRIELRPANPR
jgi:NAD(P)-dependent dehydrogenase (short-subunit alcohol dehydrogenase family)